jgi:hypothetical protein
MISTRTARRQRQQWTEQVELYSVKYGLKPDDLDAHAAERHYAAGDKIRIVIAEAAACLAESGDVHVCV